MYMYFFRLQSLFIRCMSTLSGEQISAISFLARLDEVQEELLYYPSVGVGVGVSKMFKVLR